MSLKQRRTFMFDVNELLEEAIKATDNLEDE